MRKELIRVAGHLQAITNSQLGHDVLGPCRVWLNLLTQASDEGANRMHSLAGIEPPKCAN